MAMGSVETSLPTYPEEGRIDLVVSPSIDPAAQT